MSGEIARLEDLYEVSEWKGMPQWRCKICRWDTLVNREEMVEHITAVHLPQQPSGTPQILTADRFGNVVEELVEDGHARVEVPDVSGMKVEDVLEAVEAGEMTSAEALIAEKAGKNRSTLIEELERLLPQGEKE